MHTWIIIGALLLPPTTALPVELTPAETTYVARPSAGQLAPLSLSLRPQQQAPFEYSDAYAVRLKIHKIASFATVPLFALQYLAGNQLMDGNEGFGDDEGEGGLAEYHGALAGAIAGLFGVNTITGGWNLWEARKDPEARTWRTIHGLLMLAADAGFVATGLAAGDDDGGGDRSLHKTLALTSMGISLTSYLMMLPPLRRE